MRERLMTKIGESPVDMSHTMRGWLGNNGKRVSLCLDASVLQQIVCG